MKRIYLGILLILSLLATSPLKAEKVGRDRALEAARTFFQYDRARSPRRVVLHELPFAPQTKAAADPAFYVFEREGGGFVIVAGDDRCRPVLGYSFTRPFVDPAAMPESLREWLDDYQEQVDLIRNEDLPASPWKRRPRRGREALSRPTNSRRRSGDRASLSTIWLRWSTANVPSPVASRWP